MNVLNLSRIYASIWTYDALSRQPSKHSTSLRRFSNPDAGFSRQQAIKILPYSFVDDSAVRIRSIDTSRAKDPQKLRDLMM